VIGQNGLLK